MGSPKLRILVLVDFTRDYFDNWLLHFRAVCPSSDALLEILCLDKEMEQLVQTNNTLACSRRFNDILQAPSLLPALPFIHQNATRTRNTLWMIRFLLLTRIVEDFQENVLLSDIDAIWLDDPFPMLSEQAIRSDIVSSRGSFPRMLFDQWGSTLCMGFVYVASNPSTVAFLRLVYRNMLANEIYGLIRMATLRTRKYDAYFPLAVNLSAAPFYPHTAMNCPCRLPSQQPPDYYYLNNSMTIASIANTTQTVAAFGGDDQVVINVLLAMMNISWPADMNNRTINATHRGTVSLCPSTCASAAASSTLTVALLPESLFMRNCNAKRMGYVTLSRYALTTNVIYRARRRVTSAKVAHCWLHPSVISTERGRQQTLAAYGLWRLPYSMRPEIQRATDIALLKLKPSSSKSEELQLDESTDWSKQEMRLEERKPLEQENRMQRTQKAARKNRDRELIKEQMRMQSDPTNERKRERSERARKRQQSKKKRPSQRSRQS